MFNQAIAPNNLKNIIDSETKLALENQEALDEDLKNKVKEIPKAAIICKAKEHNPNYLSILYANEKFYEIFGISAANLIGKSYDFLFNNLDFDYSSEDQIEYIRLVKAVKDFHQSSVIVSLEDHKDDPKKIKLKITFTPLADLLKENQDLIKKNSILQNEKFVKSRSYAVLTFEEFGLEINKQNQVSSNVALLKNLERSLRNERLLREVGYLIVSDLSIREIAYEIAKMLCQHLKVDRCLLHDYRQGNANFIAEYHNSYSKPMFENNADAQNLKMVADYINFQNFFYRKVGDKNKRSALIIAEDVFNDDNFSSIHDICKKFAIASQISITTSFNNVVNGGIYIHQSEKRSWLVEEIDLLETIADQFSIAIDRSYSVERVMISNHELLEKTKQLKESLKQEKNLRKMQSEFVALVSHEFKTPLQIIDSTRELLSRKLKALTIKDEGIEKSLERIKSGIERMNGLIHSTLNLAKIENGENNIKLEKQIFNLKKFVNEIIDKNLNLASQKNITILTRIDQLPITFNGDAKLLEHSITNIISNAIKYSKNNSTVQILAKTNQQKVLLRVIDQGIGIPQEDLPNIGKKFFRAKNTLAVAGTGIGLYLTKYFIELHGGSLLIESQIDFGTKITVILPNS
ncbi:MAG: GAF domain-containing sensor histidine kinase [Rickettsiales bacterium]|nr:GAF domain-containing sensor histidine kinase [Rickettsiales bacterium]